MGKEVDVSIRRTVAHHELVKGFDGLVSELADGPLLVRRRKRSEDFVLISAQVYECLLDQLEDLEDVISVLSSEGEPSIAVDLEELRRRIYGKE